LYLFHLSPGRSKEHPLPATKARIRKQLKQRRGSLAADQRVPLDRRICAHALRHLEDCGADALGAYLSHDGEPDLTPLLQRLYESGRAIYLPAIHARPMGEMEFLRWDPEAALIRSRYGVREPAGGEPAPPGELSAVLTPLLAFTADGLRLGMGAGYYDRYFGPLRARGECPQLVGVAYAWQQVESMPGDPWDVTLDAVITEHGVTYC